MKTLSVYSWDPCDQYYQLTDRWGLVPASQLPVSALLSELETHVTGDHPDTLRKWLYPDTHTLLISATTDISVSSPLSIDISFLFAGLNAIKQPQSGWSRLLPSLPLPSAAHQGWRRVRGRGWLPPHWPSPATDLA